MAERNTRNALDHHVSNVAVPRRVAECGAQRAAAQRWGAKIRWLVEGESRTCTNHRQAHYPEHQWLNYSLYTPHSAVFARDRIVGAALVLMLGVRECSFSWAPRVPLAAGSLPRLKAFPLRMRGRAPCATATTAAAACKRYR